MQAIKGKKSHQLLMDSSELRAAFWGRASWSRGFFVCSTGNVTDEVIAEYIRSIDVEHQEDDQFKVSE